MTDWPVGLSTGCFFRTSIFDCLEPILAGGFSLVEICSAPEHLDYHDPGAVHRLAGRLDALGISAYSFHAPFADGIDITSPDDAARRRSIREVLAAASAAAALGVRYLVIHPGPEHREQPAGHERLQRLANCALSLSEIAARCRELRIACALENKLPHLLFGNTADMLWLLGAMTTTGVGVCLDTGHALLGGELATAGPKLAHHLRMIHASDNSGNFDDHLPPGRGSIDWAAFLRMLRETGFGGTIMMEIAGCGTVPDILESARRARLFLRRQMWQME